MYCLHPISVRKWKEVVPYVKRLPSGEGFIEKVVSKEKTNEYHFVPCGKCVACLSRRRNEFTYRLTQEQNYSDYSFFLTLTYDKDHIPIKLVEGKPYFVFDKKNVQDYLKRVRYYISQLNKDVKISYFLVSEYGKKTFRPHYHMLFFVKNDSFLKYKSSIEKVLQAQWTYGFFVTKPTNPANIHYCTKYCIKNLEELPEQCIDPVFTLGSKRPYLGAAAEGVIDRQFDDFEGTTHRDPIVFNNGCKTAMPRIYRQKLGLSGISAAMSADPRLTQEQYNKEYIKFRKARGEENSSVRDFAKYLNQKFLIMERAAKQRQLNRSETL